MTDSRTEHRRRQALSDHEAMIDAQAGCVPCKLCGGKAVITDAGVGAGYYIACENSGAFRASQGCMITERRLGGWPYNVMDWWNRLHSKAAPAKRTVDCNLCDDTGYKDYAGFAMDVCDHQQPAPVAHGMADLLTKAIGDITAALILAGKKDKIAKWTAPYVEALNEYDNAEPAGEEPVAACEDAQKTAVSAGEAWAACTGGEGEAELAAARVIEAYGDRRVVAALGATPTNPERLVEARMSDCPSSPDGRHQVDTSMESGPNNCFYCEAPMPALSAAPLKEGQGE